MPDPILSSPENSSWVFKIINGFVVLIGALLAWMWKNQDGKVGDHESRLLILEKNSLTHDAFNGAMAASRRETREDIKNVVDELRACSAALHVSVSDLGKRLDTILIAHLEKK